MSIHPSAWVDPKAKLGDSVEVGPFAVIEGGAQIGDRCVIGPHAVIRRFVTMGPGCRVYPGACIGDEPQDLAFKGVDSFVRVGANCVMREGVTIHRGTKEGTVTQVGDNCFLMANSHLAHNVKLGNNVILANGALLGGYVEVADRAFISGNSAVHQFVRIGTLVMASGCAVMTKDVPPYCIVPATGLNRVVGLNVVGMRRAGMSSEDRLAVRRGFKVLYCSGLNVAQAVERLKKEFPEGPVRAMWEFIEGSKRGICAYAGGDEEEVEG